LNIFFSPFFLPLSKDKQKKKINIKKNTQKRGGQWALNTIKNTITQIHTSFYSFIIFNA